MLLYGKKTQIDHLLRRDVFGFGVFFRQFVDCQLDSLQRRFAVVGEGAGAEVVVRLGELAVVGADRFHGFLDRVGAIGFIVTDRFDVGAQETPECIGIALQVIAACDHAGHLIVDLFLGEVEHWIHTGLLRHMADAGDQRCGVDAAGLERVDSSRRAAALDEFDVVPCIQAELFQRHPGRQLIGATVTRDADDFAFELSRRRYVRTGKERVRKAIVDAADDFHIGAFDEAVQENRRAGGNDVEAFRQQDLHGHRPAGDQDDFQFQVMFFQDAGFLGQGEGDFLGAGGGSAGDADLGGLGECGYFYHQRNQ